MEASWWERLTEGETGSCSDGWGHAQKIQFSLDGWGCVPSLLLTMVEVMKTMGPPSKGLMQALLISVPPNPAADHCWPMHLPETPGHSWASLGQSLVGSLLLSPGSWYAQGSVCALQVSFPQSCISSGSSVLGLMAASSKRAYAIPKSAAPRAPAPAAVPCWPVPPQDTLRHSSVSVSVGSLGPGAHKLNLEKAEEPEIKLPTSVGSLKKQESSRKTSTSVLLTMSKPLTVWITRNCGKFWKKWNTRPPDLPLEKSVCRSGSNS